MRLGKLPKVAFEPVEVVPKGITWYDREVHILNAEVIDPRWFQIPFRECGYIASGWSGDIRGDLNAEGILVGFEIVCPDNEWRMIEGLKPPKGVCQASSGSWNGASTMTFVPFRMRGKSVSCLFCLPCRERGSGCKWARA